jgi:hypothetical protein
VCAYLYIASSIRLPPVRAEDHEIGLAVEEVAEWPEPRARFRLRLRTGRLECQCGSASDVEGERWDRQSRVGIPDLRVAFHRAFDSSPCRGRS